MPISRARFISLYALICLIWGSTWVAIRIGHNAHIPPFLAATLRFAVASVVLWGMVFLKKYPMPIGRRQWRAVLANGLLGSGLSYTIVYWTSQYVDSGLEAVIFGTMPLWTAVIGHYVFQLERLTPRKIAGVLVGITGIALIFLPDAQHIERRTLLAMSLMLLSPISSAVTLLITKKDAKEINPVTLNALGISIGAVIVFTCGLFAGDIRAHSLSLTSWLSILYLGIPGTVVSFVVYYILLKTTGAVAMSYVAIITPLVAVVLGWLLLGEKFTLWTWLGAATIITGVYLSLKDWSRSRPVAEPGDDIPGLAQEP